MNLTDIAPVKQQVKSRLMSREELTSLIGEKYRRRNFVPSDIKDYVNSLPVEKAFALSRLLPKEILEKLLNMRGSDIFANNIIEYASKITSNSKLLEPLAKQAEELFLVTHSSELVTMLGGAS